MNLRRLLILLLPGLAPLLVYVVASELWGDLVGLVVALALGAAEFLYLLLVQRRLDGFVALDLGFLLLTGGLSLWSGNDLFFRLKPAILEALLLVVLAVSAWGPQNLVLRMVLRGPEAEQLLKALEQHAEAARSMARNLRVMTLVLAAHVVASFVAALWMSKEAWAFVTGLLLYLVLGGWMLIQLVLRWTFRR